MKFRYVPSFLAPILCLTFVLDLSAKGTNGERNYLEYHQEIVKAEKLLGDENFEAALKVYEQVFDHYDFVFLRDYQIAAQLALCLDEKEKALFFLEKGISAGWKIKAIKKHKYLRKLKEDAGWEAMEKAYPDLRSKYLMGINQPLREQVQKMFKKDQWKALGVFLRIGDKAQQRYANKKFAPHSENQMTQLIDILRQYGYPGEQLIGNDYWMSTIISHHNSISEAYSKQDTIYRFVQPMLIQAIASGQITPYEYALMDDWQKAVASRRTAVGYGFLNPPDTSTLKETNQLRQKIGLRTVELRNKLVELQHKTGMNFYLPDWIDGKIQVEQR